MRVELRPVVCQPQLPFGLHAISQALRSGHCTSEDIVGIYLERIAALDPRLGAYEHVASREAIAAARAIDALRSAGTNLGPLMGIPVAVKDSYSSHGMPIAVAPTWTFAIGSSPRGASSARSSAPDA